MPCSVYLGNLPVWVTTDDVKSWLESSDLLFRSVRVIRDFLTQESRGYAFIEAPNQEAMESIIERFHRAPIDGRLLQAKKAHSRGGQETKKPFRKQDKHSPVNVANAANAKNSSNTKTAIGNLGEALQKVL